MKQEGESRFISNYDIGEITRASLNTVCEKQLILRVIVCLAFSVLLNKFVEGGCCGCFLKGSNNYYYDHPITWNLDNNDLENI